VGFETVPLKEGSDGSVPEVTGFELNLQGFPYLDFRLLSVDNNIENSSGSL
jgi:hypothetical protein